MVDFINLFLSYLLLFVIMAAIAGLGIFLGKVLSERARAKKELKAMLAEGKSEVSEEE